MQQYQNHQQYETLNEWLDKNWEKGSIIAPPMEAQVAVDFLSDYLLGRDWYSTAGPCNNEQINPEIVQQILLKYSREYRIECGIGIEAEIAKLKNKVVSLFNYIWNWWLH